MKTNAKSIVAAAIAAAIAAGTAVAPALAAPVPTTEDATVAIVAQSVGSDDAIASAIDASPLYGCDVAYVDWYYDCGRDDYVVTLTSYWGDVWTYWVDAQSGVAYMYA
jgi:hypothetical protein